MSKFIHITTLLITLNQQLELLIELLIKIKVAVFAPESLERLELHNELPVGVEHGTLSFNQGSPVVLVASIEDGRRLVVDAGKLESVVNLLSNVFIVHILWPLVTHTNRLVCVRLS